MKEISIAFFANTSRSRRFPILGSPAVNFGDSLSKSSMVREYRLSSNLSVDSYWSRKDIALLAGNYIIVVIGIILGNSAHRLSSRNLKLVIQAAPYTNPSLHRCASRMRLLDRLAMPSWRLNMSDIHRMISSWCSYWVFRRNGVLTGSKGTSLVRTGHNPALEALRFCLEWLAF